MADNPPPSSAGVTVSGSLNLLKPVPSGPHRSAMGLPYLYLLRLYLPTCFGKSFNYYLPIDPNIRGQEFLTLENGTNRLPRNVGRNYHYTLINSSEEHSSHLLCIGSLKSRIVLRKKYGRKDTSRVHA
jgi:hypothetical protein